MKLKIASLVCIICISGQFIYAQKSADLLSQLKAKYYSWPTVCARLKIIESKPGDTLYYFQNIYADNRNGRKRIIQIPEQELMIYYNGVTTLVLSDFNKTYFIDKDSFALPRLNVYANNISSILLTRDDGNDKSKVTFDVSKPEIEERNNSGHTVINLFFPDFPEYDITDIVMKLEFDEESKNLVHTSKSYKVGDELLKTDVYLDTLFEDASLVEQIMQEISNKKSSYAENIISYEPDILDVNISFNELEPHFKYIQTQNVESELKLVDFYYINCPPCLRSMPVIDSILNEFGSKVISLISVNAIDAPEKIEKFIIKHKIVNSSATINREYIEQLKGNGAYPTFFLFNRSGKLVWSMTGYQEDLKESLKSAIQLHHE